LKKSYLIHLLQAEHNREIDEATTYLEKELIPAFADSFSENVSKVTDIKTVNVGVMMHRAGVNLRYIGKVIQSYQKRLKENEGKKEEKKIILMIFYFFSH
jgi:hypothetical protein